MKSIVVGYDGSQSAERALKRVPELAENGAKVYLVTAVHRLSGKGGMAWDPVEKEQHEADLKRAQSQLAEAGVQVEVSEGLGDPATVITQLSKEVGADLIVIGNEHHSLIQRLVLGDVSGGVTHLADCDVLVVK
jgi:nucleotide-binding universal stress UspA family protein